MADKKVKRFVTIGGRTFAPGDSVPADLVELIDNPRAWEGPDDSQEPAEVDEVEEKTAAQKTAAKK